MRKSTYLVIAAVVLAAIGLMIAIQVDETNYPLMLDFHGLLYTSIFCMISFLVLSTVAATLILTGKDA